jgi:hypothetical protein
MQAAAVVPAALVAADDSASAQVAKARSELMDSASVMLSVACNRPDVQWTVANLCWQSRLVLAGEEARAQRHQLLAWVQETGSPHLARWVEEALDQAPPLSVPSYGGKPGLSPAGLRDKVHDWEQRGMYPPAPAQ